MKLLTVILLPFILFTQSFAQELEQRMSGDPLDNLPNNVEILTQFGERADFSPDNKRIAFMSKSFGDAMVIDLQTGEVINFSKKPGAYNEAEGIFPDGRFTTVESDNQCDWLGGRRGPWNIDIWKLELDGTGENWERLTHFNDYEGHKASNPVISTDGKLMAFQTTSTTAPAGVGFGLLLYRFK